MSDAADLILSHVSSMIAAVGALGTASYGLVDTSKALSGGVSNVGFGAIRKLIDRLGIGTGGTAGLSNADIQGTLKANWINGQPKADQKAAAKSLIRLSLTPTNSARLAAATGLDPIKLEAVAVKVRDGVALAPEDVSVVGRFDAIVSALLDEAYERGDQQYRNWSKLAAALVAIALAVLGGAILSGLDLSRYLTTWQCGTAILIGAISTPLAPIAKDLSSALQTAVKAVASLKR